MYKALSLVPFLLLGSSVLAAPQAGTTSRCTRDSCQAVVARSGSADCATVIQTTVTPSTRVATVTTTQTQTTQVTQTLTGTQTNTATLSTSTEIDTVTVTVTTTGAMKKRAAITQAVDRRQAPMTVPGYATSACGNYNRFSSACRCNGASTTTITAPTPLSTTTVTSSVNFIRTIRTRSTLTITGGTATATQTSTITSVVTSTSTTTVTTTVDATSTLTSLTTTTTGTATTTSTTTSTTTTATPSPTPFYLMAQGGPNNGQYAFLNGDDPATVQFVPDTGDANVFTIDNMQHLGSFGLFADTLDADAQPGYTLYFDTADTIAQEGYVYLTCSAAPTGTGTPSLLNCTFRNGVAVFQNCPDDDDVIVDTAQDAGCTQFQFVIVPTGSTT
ncbi:hypothetical protein PG997_013692 [Apiospora hydei]|uniref:Uncharacterized protein n=1 Tax=Apiospora hydei TaxID=1337664 RepID=A0ABR1V6Z7_9PEZI